MFAIFCLFCAVFVVVRSHLLYSAGSNSNGMLGVGLNPNDFFSSYEFLNINGSGKFSDGEIKKVSMGEGHSAILTEVDNAPIIFMWGDNSFGQIGKLVSNDKYFANLERYSPQNVILNDDFYVDVACGGSHTLVLTNKGRVFVFGQNTYKQLGIADIKNLPGCMRAYCYQPQELDIKTQLDHIGDKVVAVKAIDNRSYLLTKNGLVFAFGDCTQFVCGLYDEEGDSLEIVKVPTLVTYFMDKKIINLALGREFTIFVDESNTPYSIGVCDKGKLGYPSTKCENYNQTLMSTKPQKIEQLESRVKSISSGDDHTLVLTTDNKLYGFGRDNKGQLGLPNESGKELYFDKPTQIPIETFEVKNEQPAVISAGKTGSCIASKQGSVCCMGYSDSGELGYPENMQNDYCVPINSLSGIKQITTIAMHNKNTLVAGIDKVPQTGLSGGAIAGIVIGILVAVGIVIVAVFAVRTKCWSVGKGIKTKKRKGIYIKYLNYEDENYSLLENTNEIDLLKGRSNF